MRTNSTERIHPARDVRIESAIAAADGFMDFHLSEAEFSRAVIARASRVMVVADRSKFTAQAPVKVSGFAEVDMLITDQPPPPPIAKCLSEAGVKVTIAD